MDQNSTIKLDPVSMHQVLPYHNGELILATSVVGGPSGTLFRRLTYQQIIGETLNGAGFRLLSDADVVVATFTASMHIISLHAHRPRRTLNSRFSLNKRRDNYFNGNSAFGSRISPEL